MSSSSLTAAARSEYLLGLLARFPDRREGRGRRHWLGGLVAVSVAAVSAGSRSFAAVGGWAAGAGAGVLAGLGAVRAGGGVHVRARVRPDQRGRARPGHWRLAAHQGDAAGGWLVIAAGGTAVRGARGREEKAPRLVAALARGIGAVLGQVAVDAEPDEIPAVRELLDAFTDLAGAVITAGALHTQGGTGQAITGRDARCVMTVKASCRPWASSWRSCPGPRSPRPRP